MIRSKNPRNGEKAGGRFSLSGLPKQNLTASRALVHAHGLVGDDLLAKVLVLPKAASTLIPLNLPGSTV
jgi:hypothetical protein